MPDKITPSEFAQKIKAKYPEYKDVDDSTLTSKMLEKYPEYRESISMDEPKSQAKNPFGSGNIVEASDKISKPVSIVNKDVESQYNAGVQKKKEAISKGLKKANTAYELANGKDAVATIRKVADRKERKAVDMEAIIDPSYMNIPGRTAATIVKAGADLAASAVSLAREGVEYAKSAGEVGAPKLYDEYGELTEHAKKVGWSDDFLGKMVLGANGLSEDASVILKNTSLPNTFMGNGISTLVHMAPDLILAEASGGSSLIGKGAGAAAKSLANQTLTDVTKRIVLNPFAKIMATRAGSEAYNAAEKQGADFSVKAKEGAKGAWKGFEEGALMEVYGFSAGKIGEFGSKALKATGIVSSPGAWTGALTNTAGQMLAFGGVPMLKGDKEGAKTGIFLGGLFGVLHGKANIKEQRLLDRQIKEINPELGIENTAQILADITHANRLNNFHNATPEAIKTAYESKMSANEMNARALEAGERALKEGDPVRKKELMAESDTWRKSSDIKQSAESVVENKQDWVDYVEANERLTPEQKRILLEKVEQVSLEYNPTEKAKTELSETVTQTTDQVRELNQRLANESDPVKKAQIQVQLDAIKSEAKESETRLKEIASREADGASDPLKPKEPVEPATPAEVASRKETDIPTKGDVDLLKAFDTPGDYVFRGERGEFKMEGEKVIFETKSRVFEIGTREELAGKRLSDYGIEKNEKMDVSIGSDGNELTIDGRKYFFNNEGRSGWKGKQPKKEPAIKYDKEGNVVSVSVVTPTGQKRVIRGERATEIAYQHKLRQFEQNAGPRKIEEAHQEVDRIIAENGGAKEEVRAAEPQAEARSAEQAPEVKTEPQADTIVGQSTEITTAEPITTQPVTRDPQEVKVAGEVTAVKKEPEVKSEELAKEEPVDVEVESPAGEKISINHKEMESIREEFALEEIQKEGTTAEAIVAAAAKSIKAGVSVPNLVKRMNNGAFLPSAKDQAVVGIYIEALTKRNNEAPSSDLLNSINEASTALFNARSRIGLALGVTRQLPKPKQDLTNYMALEQAAMGVKKLKPEDTQRLKSEWDKAESARKKYETALKKAEESSKSDPDGAKALAREAQSALDNVKKATAKTSASRKTSKTAEDFAAERADIKAKMLEALKKANRGGTAMATVPLAPQLIAIAPHVAKLVKSYVEEGVVKLEEVMTRLEKDTDYIAVGITQSDMYDVITGKYNKKVSRTETAKKLADIRTEAKLLIQLEKLQSAPEPKSPLQAQRKSDRIEDLKEAVKEARKRNREDFPEEYDKASIARRTKMLKEKAAAIKKELDAGGFMPEVEKRKPVKLDAEGQKAYDEYIAFLKESNIRRDNYKFQNQTPFEKYLDYGQQALGLRRLVQTSFDLSMPGRQAVIQSLNPRHWGLDRSILSAEGVMSIPDKVWNSTNMNAWGAMLRNVTSQKGYDRMMFEMEKTEPYERMVADKITFNSLSALENKYRNEDFRTSFIYKIPDAVGKLPKAAQIPFLPVVGLVRALEASQRGADTFLNVSRYELYLRGENNLIKHGVTRDENPEAYKEMAKWVMNMTGRGNLVKAWEAPQMQTILGNTFYGTRLMASRFNMLNPYYYYKMPDAVRVEAMKDILGYVGTFSALSLGMQAAGFTVSLNPDEADFLKAKKGDTRFDLSGGFGQYIRTAFRIGHAFYNTLNPQVRQEEKIKYGAFALKSTTSFFDYKLAPNASYLLNALRSKDALGNEFEPMDFFKIYPMYMDDIKKGYSTGDWSTAVAVVGASTFGIGAQSYGARDERQVPELKLKSIKEQGATYDVSGAALDERKKLYEEYYKTHGDKIRKMYKNRAANQKAKVEAGKKKGLTEGQLKYKYKEFFMTEKEIENKVEDEAIDFSKKKILRKYKSLPIVEE